MASYHSGAETSPTRSTTTVVIYRIQQRRLIPTVIHKSISSYQSQLQYTWQLWKLELHQCHCTGKESVLEFSSSTTGEEPANVRTLLPNSASELARTSTSSSQNLANMPLLPSVWPQKLLTREFNLQGNSLESGVTHLTNHFDAIA